MNREELTVWLFEQLSNRLKTIEEEQGKSSEEIIKELEIKPRTYVSYLRKEHLPSSLFLWLLHDKLKINLNWFISGKGKVHVDENESLSYEDILRSKYNLKKQDIEIVQNLVEFLSKRNS